MNNPCCIKCMPGNPEMMACIYPNCPSCHQAKPDTEQDERPGFEGNEVKLYQPEVSPEEKQRCNYKYPNGTECLSLTKSKEGKCIFHRTLWKSKEKTRNCSDCGMAWNKHCGKEVSPEKKEEDGIALDPNKTNINP